MAQAQDGQFKIHINDLDEDRTFTDKTEFYNTKQILDQGGHDYNVVNGPDENGHAEGETDSVSDSADDTPQETPEQDAPEFEGQETPDESPQEVVIEPSAETPVVDSEEQFVTEIKGVPETFVVDMGGSPHIRKEGYYYLAAEMGLTIQTEPLNPTWDGDDETSAWKGIVRDGEKTWSNVGTAHLEHEDMQGAVANLDELASTRAACRALSMATGTGVASMEEMIGADEK